MTISINGLKFKAYARVDAAAGDVRKSYITDVAGQQAVYLEKRTEAGLYVAAHSTDPGGAVAGPHIRAEAAEMGVSDLVLAQRVLTEAQVWLTELSPAIEAKRIGGKEKIRLASTPEDIEAECLSAVAALYALLE
jgi:hypothetical protein